jgi:hypothetical protein
MTVKTWRTFFFFGCFLPSGLLKAATGTITTLASVAPAAPAFGQTVTLTATVSPALAPGAVSFMDGGVLVGSGTLDTNGVARATTLTLPAGIHSLRAVYGGGGSGAYAPSQSGALGYIVTAAPGAAFSPAASPAAGSSPYSVAVGDFNGDGKADLAVANAASNSVSVLLGNGNGTFSAAPSPAVGSNPFSVAIADFNGDGKVDLAVANYGTNMVSILLGNGDGTFSAADSPPTGNFPHSVVAGDFNGDGKADLAVANEGSSNLTILLGNGDGTFSAAASPVTGGIPVSVAVADFNGDGSADLVVANANNILTILLGNGDGTFSTTSFPSAGTNPLSVAVGDFNRDGKPDLAVVNVVSNNLSILLGNGDGTFLAAASPATGNSPRAVVVGDFNGDGKIDLAVTNGNDNTATILLGNGNGTFSPGVSPSTGTGPYSAAVGDFNGDGRADLALGNYSSSNVSILLATVPVSTSLSFVASPNPSQFGQAVTLTAGVIPSGAPGSVEFLDGTSIIGAGPLISGQAQIDTSLLASGTSALLARYAGVPGILGPSQSSVLNQAINPVAGFGFRAAASLGTGGYPGSLAVADFNEDGNADLAVLSFGSGTVSILLGHGDGTFSAAAASPATGSAPLSLAVGDFNGDGKADLAVTNLVSDTVSILLGNGNGTFTAAPSPRAGTAPSQVVVGDFNGDGKADLAVADIDSNTVSILLGNGDGTFVAAPSPVTGSGPRSVAEGDFNGDGKADLAVVNSNGNNVSILLGDGNGTFTAAASPATGLAPESVAVADFNGDGKADLAVANASRDTVSILLGNGDGTFTAGASPATGIGPAWVVVADFNGDSKPDLAVANSYSNNVSILLGNGDGTFSAAASPSTGSYPQSLAVADFNGDGRADLAVANYESNSVSILLGCSAYSIGPTSANVTSVAGSGSINVTAPVGCFWTAASNSVFLTIVSGSSGTGNGTVGYSIAANSGGVRTGILTIAGQTFIVNQAAAPAMSLSQTTLNFAAGGGAITPPQTVTISFGGGAAVNWTASSNQPNVLVSPTAGAGLETLTISASAGPSAFIVVSAPGAGNSPQHIQVNISSVTPGAPFGSFDTPANNSAGLAGSIAVTGWALDGIEVTGVNVMREPVAGEPASPPLILVGAATFVAGARPDVQALYATTPFNDQAGWGYLLLTNELPNNGGVAGPGNGTYKLHAIATNKSGVSVDLGTKTITVNNAAATLPFGAIDTPGQGATVSGTVTNFGWGLTPPAAGCPATDQPCIIPVNGFTIFVFVDGQPMGNPVYNLARCDVDQLFPGYANSGSTNCAQNGIPPGPVGYFNLDTTKLINGVHTIAWSVTDNAGKAQGIGSRYFTVEN